MSRDFQRQRVYDAEHALCDALGREVPFDFFGSMLTLPLERKFGTVENVQHYVDKVLALNWVRARWDPRPIEVRERRGQDKAHYQCGTIAVPVLRTWALREEVVLHEVAHHLANDGHGPEFAAVLGVLLREIVGPEVGLVWRYCCDITGARVDDKLMAQIA